MDELHEKIARLPAWARGYIKKLETAREPLLEEASRCRRKAESAEKRMNEYKYRCDSMVELLSFAHKGGHPDAGEYVRYIASEYGPTTEDVEDAELPATE